MTTKYKLRDNKEHHIFCSHKCYSEYRKKYYVKEKASVYKKIKVNCSNCQKEILVPPNRLEHKNKYDEKHVFCCKECYYEFRSKYYIGNKSNRKGKKITKYTRNKIRKATLEQYSSGNLDRQTVPQKIINNILDELNIHYTNEKVIGYYSIDNYLEDCKLMIEVMGDYFHANPNIYNIEQINNMQQKDIIRDKRKRTYIKKYHNVEILYLWETQIKTEPNLCKLLIAEYIKNNGKLSDYNSFNFFVCENKLKLKDNIINPYFIKNP